MSDFTHYRKPKAQREYRCDDCGRYTIQPGEHYLYIVCKTPETGFHTYRICGPCVERNWNERSPHAAVWRK